MAGPRAGHPRMGGSSPPMTCGAVWLTHRLLKIADNIRRILDPDAQPHHIIARTRLGPVLVGQLAMGGGGGMDDLAAGVADIGEMGKQLDAVDQLDPRL